MRLHSLFLGVLLLSPMLLGGSLAVAQEQSDADLARQLLDSYDDLYRGESSAATVTMNVVTERWSRSLTMKSWSKGDDKSLIRIEAPAKEAGITTLKVDQNIWNYLPRVGRTMKVPAGMMGGSWMGSHFTNDDLVRDSRMSQDYTYAITGRPAADGTGFWVIECTVKEDAAVVWGKVTVTLRPDKLPSRIDYYDEGGEHIRTMEFADYKEVGGRLMPARMTLLPLDKPGEKTEMVYDELNLGAELDDSMFTLQSLKK
jgi:outer membrane lipoprotein-sorting protein